MLQVIIGQAHLRCGQRRIAFDPETAACGLPAQAHEAVQRRDAVFERGQRYRLRPK
jgi:hypothetical protein